MSPSGAVTATTSKSKPAKSITLAGFAGPRPAKRSRPTQSETPLPVSPFIAVSPSTRTAPARSSHNVASLASALRQAVMELNEAASVIRNAHGLPATAAVFKAAADRKRELLEALHV